MEKTFDEEYMRLLTALRNYKNPVLPHVWFNMIKHMIECCKIERGSPKLSMTLPENQSLTINIGQRWVAKDYGMGLVGLIFPLWFNENKYRCGNTEYFTRKKQPEAKFSLCELKPDKPLPESLYAAWIQACQTEATRSKTSGYRRFHSALFYDAVMQLPLRNEIFHEAFYPNKENTDH